MTDFNQRLRQLGAEVEYPPTPPLARAVTQRLDDEREKPAGSWAGSLTWPPLTARAALLAAVLLLLVAGTVVAAVPAARHALLDLVGLRGATVQRVDTLPEGVKARLGQGLGEASTLEAVERSVAFHPLLPSDLGEPNGVFLNRDPPGGELSLTYAPRPGLARSRYTGVGLLVNEVNGTYVPGFFGKLIPRGVRIERLHVAGHHAIWVEGLHEFFYKDSTHTFRIERTRLAGNALLVQSGPVLVRIEGRLALGRAAAIARSLR
ncbi:MAG TPA: hypothetical protein VGC63_08010 [Solirubrobacterales bacterium]